MSAADRKSRLGFVLVILALAVGYIGYLSYQRTQEKEAFEQEKIAMTEEITNFKKELMAQMGTIDTLNQFIEAETARYSAIIDSINKANATEIAGFRYRIKKMRNENAAVVARLDSVNAAYAALNELQMMTADSLSASEMKVDALNQANSTLSGTVARGKQLVLATSSNEGLRITRSGRERRTKRANKVDVFRACVTLAENRIADKGQYVLYMRILGADGKPIEAPEKNIAVMNGKRMNYHGMASVDYTGAAKEVCLDGVRSTNSAVDLEGGVYTVEVYTERYKVGTTTIEFR